MQRENDVEHLRRIASAQQIQIKQLMRVLSAKCQELEALKGNPQELQQTLALLNQLQKQAQAQAEPQSKTNGSKPRKTRSTSGPTEQPELPIDQKVFELDEPDRTCSSCGLRLEPMAGQFEESELIDFVETAPGPERAIKGGRYSLAFAIKVALDKYLDHIPLARQQRILARHGVVVTAQTLWDQLYALGMRLANTAEALFQHALAHPVIGLDQTGWPKLDGKGEKLWQMWCVTAPGVVCHKIRDDKGADTFRALVGKYRGVIVCDALKTHEAGARGNDQIRLAGCWAHYPERAVIRSCRRCCRSMPNNGVSRLQIVTAGFTRTQGTEGDLVSVSKGLACRGQARPAARKRRVRRASSASCSSRIDSSSRCSRAPDSHG